MGKLMRKLNNKSGKSIFMALLLLLVAVVVSVVIVTVAITSVMHVQDNKTSQQEYLACASAAEMLRDVLDESTYIQTDTKTTKYTYDWYSYKYVAGEPTTSTTYKAGDTNRSEMAALIKYVSEGILKNETVAEKDFTVKVSGMKPEEVTASVKLVSKGTNSAGESAYELRFKFYAQADSDSQGYRMSMVVPIVKGSPKVKADYNTRETYSRDEGYTYSNVKETTITVTWGGSGTKISKGWDAYDKQVEE